MKCSKPILEDPSSLACCMETENESGFKKRRKKSALEKESLIDESTRCKYIMAMKNRRCRMVVKQGLVYCGEHAVHDKNNTDRMVCPIDNRHTILISGLEVHLKKCNSRIIEKDYIKVDANSVKAETKFTDKIDRRPVEHEIVDVVHKVWACYEEWAKDQLIVEERKNELVEKHLEDNKDLGLLKRKHLVQISSILGHIEESGVLQSDSKSCMFELGAGKGQLAYWLSKMAPNANYVLMDRSGSRNKWDKNALKENPGLKLERFRCSIEHMDLSKIDILKESSSVLAVCKHFCGSATDAGIRSLLNSDLKLDAALLIPCCHHKSRFVEYGGHALLKRWNMDSEEAFSALRYIASFATNGMKEVDKSSAENDEGETNTWKNLYPPLELGRRAKTILELGRAEWLRTVGFETKVIEYVPPCVSPENLLILAIKKR